MGFKQTIFLFLFLFIFSTALASSLRRIHGLGESITSSARIMKIKNLSKATNRQSQPEVCTPNLCFVLQGGKSVTERDYSNQKAHTEVLLLAISSDTNFNVAAVQYSSVRTPISSLTNNLERFTNNLQASNVDEESGSTTGLASSMRFCERAMRSLGDAKKFMIVHGDRFSFATRREEAAARSFRNNGGEVIVLPVGDYDSGVLERLTGSAEPVASASSHSSLFVPFEVAEHVSLSLPCLNAQ